MTLSLHYSLKKKTFLIRTPGRKSASIEAQTKNSQETEEWPRTLFGFITTQNHGIGK